VPNKNAILLLSHLMNQDVLALYESIESDCGDHYDVTLLADNTQGLFNDFKDDQHFSFFTLTDLQAFSYPGRNQLAYPWAPEQRSPYHRNRNFRMGHTDLPILNFWANNDQYDYYWVIEHDVRFTGNWLGLLDHFNSSEADLLATSLMAQELCPDWPRWKTLELPGGNTEAVPLLRGFFPIYRISNRALALLHRECLAGACGHYECLMPTLLNRGGLLLEDIGGDGPFTRPENINRFYRNTPSDLALIPGTFVFRPERSEPGDEPDTLWHPVKPASKNREPS
jgi:hypothetical protein